MAVSIRLPQQIDGLSALIDLVDMIKNPSSIKSAHEIARKEMSLTVAEQEKVTEARDAINKYPLLIAEIEKQKKDLEEAKAQLASEEEDYKKRSDVLVSKEEFIANREAQYQTDIAELNQKHATLIEFEVTLKAKTDQIKQSAASI